MHAASRVLAAGRRLPAPRARTARCSRAEAGRRRRGHAHRRRQEPDDPLSRALLAERGLTPGRGPPSDAVRRSRAQRVQRFATYEDLDGYETTIEEREEYEPHLDAGRVVFAGVDYEAILHEAELEADVILWDGGNNDFPFYRPDLYIVVADPLRPGDELRYHPGETNVRMADVVVINKIDSAEPGAVDAVRAVDRRS